MSIITSPNLLYQAWAILVIAAIAPFILARMDGDARWLELLRSRAKRKFQSDADFKNEVRRNAKLAMVIAFFAALAFAYSGSNRGWELLVVLIGPVIAMAFTVPLAVAHTFLLRFFPFRALVSIALAVVLGSVAASFLGPEWKTPLIGYGLIYGSHVALLEILPRQIEVDSPAKESDPQPFW